MAARVPLVIDVVVQGAVVGALQLRRLVASLEFMDRRFQAVIRTGLKQGRIVLDSVEAWRGLGGALADVQGKTTEAISRFELASTVVAALTGSTFWLTLSVMFVAMGFERWRASTVALARSKRRLFAVTRRVQELTDEYRETLAAYGEESDRTRSALRRLVTAHERLIEAEMAVTEQTQSAMYAGIMFGWGFAALGIRVIDTTFALWRQRDALIALAKGKWYATIITKLFTHSLWRLGFTLAAVTMGVFGLSMIIFHLLSGMMAASAETEYWAKVSKIGIRDVRKELERTAHASPLKRRVAGGWVDIRELFPFREVPRLARVGVTPRVARPIININIQATVTTPLDMDRLARKVRDKIVEITGFF